MRTTLKKLLLTFCLLLSLILLSAFRYDDSYNLTRIQFANLLGMSLLDALPDLACADADFSDLNDEQKRQAAVVVGSGIMNGFSDGRFRPDTPLRNHEVLHYLERTWQFLRVNAPETRIVQKIGRIVGLGRSEFYRNSKSSYSIFPEKAKSFEFAETEVFNRIRNLLFDDTVEHEFSLTIEDSLTRKPLARAFIAINDRAFAANESGVVIANDLHGSELEILVSAPGYVPLKLKRSFMQKTKVRLRLRPIRPKVVVRAISEDKGLPLSDFEARMGNAVWKKANKGQVMIRGEFSGYHQIQVRREKSKTVSRNVFLSEEPVELEMKL